MSTAMQTINSLGMEDLRFLNRLIVDRMRAIVNNSRKSVMGNFQPGNRVRFIASSGETKTGTVIRINQKTISVAVDGDQGWWKVSPELLKHIGASSGI